jgi:membrane protease YdiL (CAAX protease family)
MACSWFGYPPALTAVLYATLAYGSLLCGSKPAEEQSDLKAAAVLRLPAERFWPSTPKTTLAGLVIALLFPIPPYRQPFLNLLIVYAGLLWIVAWETVGTAFKITTVAAIFFIVSNREKRSVETIGWRKPRLDDVVLGVAAFVAIQGVFSVTYLFALKAMPSAAAEIRVGGALYRTLPLSLNLLGAISNAVAEEVGFRGYALERLTEIIGSRWLGAGIPYVVEVFCHAPIWGLHGMLVEAAPLLIFVLLYVWQRSLPACIIAHLLADIIPIFW